MTDDPSPETIGGTRYTLEDLSAYVDRGRTPRIDEIEEDAECRALLETMERLGTLSRELMAHDVAAAPAVDEAWLGRLLGTIGRELRAGRDIPLTSSDPATSLAITEGAVRELIRNAGDSVDGVLVGASRVEGDLAAPGSPLRIHLAISVVLTAPVHERAEAVRQRVYTELLKHTELDVASVDVTVTDVHEPLDRGDRA